VYESPGNMCSKCKGHFQNGELNIEFDLEKDFPLYCNKCYRAFLVTASRSADKGRADMAEAKIAPLDEHMEEIARIDSLDTNSGTHKDNTCDTCHKYYPNGQMNLEVDLSTKPALFCDKCYETFLRRVSYNKPDSNEAILAREKLDDLKDYIKNFLNQ